ncbi:MAG: hypothetical protein L0099_08065 [Acidobacteria bacterium]|nr:hypothetical protein [Acidobacteriota bacterium]
MVWAAVAVLVGIVIVASHFLEQRRVKALEQAALEIGFTFEREADLQALGEARSVHLLGLGHSQQLRNLMRGHAGGGQALLFDFEYTQGAGKYRQTYIQTVAAFRLKRGVLPGFQLGPESVLHKVGALFGYQDIDFDSHPQFSSRFLVRGPDENAIRAVFDPGVLGFFEGLEKGQRWWVEGQGEWLIAYRWAEETKPARLRQFLEEASAIATLVAGRARSQRAFSATPLQG